MRIPEFLKENGTIGFVAPSYGCNIEPYKSAFDHAQDILKQRGYRLLSELLRRQRNWYQQ